MLSKDVFSVMDKYFALRSAEDWDNSGVQISGFGRDINKILLCVDVNMQTAAEAVAAGAELIISHHPLFFHGMKSVAESRRGDLVRFLIKSDIAVYSAHTCFDSSPYGFNTLAESKLGFHAEAALQVSSSCAGYGLGAVGDLFMPVTFAAYAASVKKAFGSKVIKISSGYNDKIIRRAAFCSGAGADFIGTAAEKGADVLITADCKNSAFLEADDVGLLLISPTHFESEHDFIDISAALLARELPGVSLTAAAAGDIETFI